MEGKEKAMSTGGEGVEREPLLPAYTAETTTTTHHLKEKATQQTPGSAIPPISVHHVYMCNGNIIEITYPINPPITADNTVIATPFHD